MEQRLPKVSVIIPVYNRDEFVRETVESALNQTYPHFEVVAIDDGSTDGSRRVLESFGGRITILEHPGRVNRGQSAAINLGLRATENEYVAILDSDDLWAPNKIKRQIEALHGTEYGLVYCNGYNINEAGEVLYPIFYDHHRENNRPEDVLLNCYFNVPSNSLISRGALEAAGEFDEGLRSAQDHDMAIRLAEVTRLCYLPEPLWYYRRHQNTQSGRHADRRWRLGFVILANACRRYPYPLAVRNKRRAVLHFRLGQCLMEKGERLKAAFHFALAGLLDLPRALRVGLGREKVSSHHS